MPGVLQSMGSQGVGYDRATEQQHTCLLPEICRREISMKSPFRNASIKLWVELFFFFFFGCAEWLAGSQFTDQGLNLGHMTESWQS